MDADRPREELYEAVSRVLEEQFRYGLSPAEAVDRLAVGKGDRATGEWANVRGVTHATVSGNISNAREKVNINRLDAEVVEENGDIVVRVTDGGGEVHDLPFSRETQVVNADDTATLELVYESHTAIHGYYTGEQDEYEASLWYDGRPSNSFEEFDHFDEYGNPRAKADTVLWASSTNREQ